MSILYGAYVLGSSAFFLALLPPFWIYTRLSGRFKENLHERLGYPSPEILEPLSGYPRIWMHAVSLGEVKVALSIIKALKKTLPGCAILLSTSTEHGRNLARESLDQDIPVFYAPIDFIGSVRKALSRVRPDIMVFLETEIWPAWLMEARRMGIKTALLNGRISKRSIGGYLRFRPFFREVLEKIDVFSMISEEDGARIRAMGADSRRIRINRNAKYDLLPDLVDPALEAEMRKALNLGAGSEVFIAGSTRSGEEPLVLEAYGRILKAFPETVLIIAPRHIDRSLEIKALVEGRGFRCQLRSELDGDRRTRRAPVLILNTFGELFRVYSVGTVVFCGGSLVPLGGQNPLEPAVWGKAVLYGPYMDNFMDAKGLLEEAEAGISVTGPEMLAQEAIRLLKSPEALRSCGARAREAVLGCRFAAEKHASVLAGLVTRGSPKAVQDPTETNGDQGHDL